ncbi:hypothetical protein KGF54_001792 [Candida jiufengensis]|uniref:uncharacterized protein n=1 Tax=Candida jiufengensis TaxID=497108 RepID=UPI002224969E|nr:uncharacterized protein KGF54_001792 [Candida jiufengensis]KAI5955231.1 hypothetical protein KGF54_001792 [Candida jiufengensis]
MTEYKNTNNNLSVGVSYKPHVNNNPIISKQNNNKKFNNKSKKYDHRNDNEITQLESQLKQGKKVNGNSRKNQISINHLLDFQSYRDTEEYAESQQRQKQRRRSSSHKKYQQPSKIQLTGMKFINVNFKFVVDSRKNYRIQELDPNVPIDINNIISIIASRGSSCPICLSDDPIAPRMIVSCGHIICLKCVLSLLEHEVPKAKKKESSAIIEKYRECPLCFSIIRKNELKPVIFEYVDERFEIPKIKDDVVLTLMSRDSNKILSLPKSIAVKNQVNDFPNVNQTELSAYSRIFKGDFDYLKQMYENEKIEILQNHEEEKLIYNDDQELVQKAIAHIDKEIEDWSSNLSTTATEKNHISETSPHHHNTFFYYQTGFNANCIYVLSPLDMKVLKSTYIDYQNLPSTIISKIENIRYEELSSETSINKYKYLSHLPIGTQIGFLECNWNHNEFISQETWNLFKEDLLKRSKNSNKKFNREERNKKKAENEEELKTLQFYLKENGQYENTEYDSQFDYQNNQSFNFGSLSITDHRDNLPTLSDQHLSTTESENDYQTTVWGTKIPKSKESATKESSSAIEDEFDDWDAEEMIRKAREENEDPNNDTNTNKKKKKKKRLVLLSS